MNHIKNITELWKLNSTTWLDIESRTKQLTGVVPCFCKIQNPFLKNAT